MKNYSPTSRKKTPNSTIISLVVISLCFIVVGSIFALINIRSTDERSQASGGSNVFVTRQSTKFMVGDNEFKFVGFNLFDAVGSGNSPYSCLEKNGWWTKFSDAEIDTALKTMKRETGATVLRFWAFQTYTKGAQDFSGFDKVIRVAKQNGFKVLPVLEDGPGYCTEPGGGGNAHQEKWKYQGDTWYTDGYKVANAPYTMSYRDYVKAVVTKYKDEPVILGWMLMNEADTSKRVTSADGKSQSALVNFTRDMGSLVKNIDRNHLLTVGTQSNGASGATGQDFIDVYGSDYIDFTEAHDWGYWGNDNESIPGGVKNADGTMSLPDPLSKDCLKTYQAKVGCSLAQSTKVLNKPFVMGESGIAATDDITRAKRAQLMDAKMKAFFDNGGDGYLYWQWNKILDAQHYDLLPTTNDPLMAVIKKYAGFEIDPTVFIPSPSLLPTPIPTLKPSPAFPSPVLKPTPVPSPVLKPSPIPSPVVKPSPVQTPVPSNVSSSLEGEKFTGAGTVVHTDRASGGLALLLDTNSTVKGVLSGPIKKLILSVRPDKCFGSPHINVKVNGSYVLDKNIDENGFTDYVTEDLSYLKLGSGTYTVEVIYNNDSNYPTCSRNVYLDRVVAQ